MDMTEMLKAMCECTSDEATVLIQLATNDVLLATNRSVLPKKLEAAVLDIALIRFNRMGSEGETARNQGGVRISFESLPEHIRRALSFERLAGVGGHAFEQKTNETISVSEENR